MVSSALLLWITKDIIEKLDERRKEAGKLATIDILADILKRYKYFWHDMARSSSENLNFDVDYWKSKELYSSVESISLSEKANIINPFYGPSINIAWLDYMISTIDAMRKDINKIFDRYILFPDPRIVILLHSLEKGLFLGMFRSIYGRGILTLRNPPDGGLYEILEDDIKRLIYLEQAIITDFDRINYEHKEAVMNQIMHGLKNPRNDDWLPPPYD